MATNLYFTQGVRSEQNLYEDIVIEALKMYGQDVYYLPRTIVNEDKILNEDIPSSFSSAYKIEMYIENVDGFDGEGDLLTKFGVQIRDAATFIVARRRWDNTVKRYNNEINSVRPLEGDLIYLPLSNKLFEIMHVEHERPFYQLKNLPTYKLRCELFEYSGEDLDTDLEEIDGIESLGYTIDLQLVDSDQKGFVVGRTVTQSLPSGVSVTGEIVKYNDPQNILTITHIGSNSDTLHMFTAGQITSTDDSDNPISRIVASSIEKLPVNSKNDDFGNVDFIDFTENNPFGDPSNV